MIKVDLDTLFFPQNFRRMLRENPRLRETQFLGHASAHTFPSTHGGFDYTPVGAAYAVTCAALRGLRCTRGTGLPAIW